MDALTGNDDDHGDEVEYEYGVVPVLVQQERGQRDGHRHGLLAVWVAILLPVVLGLQCKIEYGIQSQTFRCRAKYDQQQAKPCKI